MENHIEMSWGARRRYRGEETGNTGMSILSAMRCLYQFSFPQAVGNLSDAPSASPHDRSRPGHPILLGVVLSRRHAGSSLTLSQDLPDSDRNTSLVPDHQRSVLDNMVARLQNDHGLLPDGAASCGTAIGDDRTGPSMRSTAISAWLACLHRPQRTSARDAVVGSTDVSWQTPSNLGALGLSTRSKPATVELALSWLHSQSCCF